MRSLCCRLNKDASKSYYADLLRQFSKSKALAEGQVVHSCILNHGHHRDTLLGNLLVDMYGKCGAVEEASWAFRSLHERNVFSWTIMITTFAHIGHCRKALQLFRFMDLEGTKPSEITLASVLRACSSIGDLAEGKTIHARILSSEFQPDIVTLTVLVDMYGKCGDLDAATRVFEQMPIQRNVVAWNAIIGAYVDHCCNKEAIYVFRRMQLDGANADAITFVAVLAACANLGNLAEGKVIHKLSELAADATLVKNANLNMYGKCGSLHDARNLFDHMIYKDVVSWTTMLAAYAQHGHYTEALGLFQRMEMEGVKPNEFTFASLLVACSESGALAEGKAIHERILVCGLENQVVLANALVNMYSRCGSLDEAKLVFDEMPQRGVVTWTCMVAAYAQKGHSRQSLELVWKMDLEGMKLNKVTLMAAAHACSSLEEANAILARIVSSGYDVSDVTVGTVVVTVLGRFGKLDDARVQFRKMSLKNAISWNALIAAYGQHGGIDEATGLFMEMNLEGVKPNEASFVSILSACSHAGFQDQSYKCFRSIAEDYNMLPSSEHYGCMIDLLGRAGLLVEAEELVNSMPFEPDIVKWMSLLAGCQLHGDPNRGSSRAAEHVFRLEMHKLNRQKCTVAL